MAAPIGTLLRVVDIETTGEKPETGCIIELGICDLVMTETGWEVGHPYSRLFTPTTPITAESRAVHYIAPEDIPEDAGAADQFALESHLMSPEPYAFFAHNSEFETGFITERSTGSVRWVCTFKAALRVYPDSPRHSNSVLRFHLGLPTDRALAEPAHRAGPDAYVTAHLLKRMIDDGILIRDILNWTMEYKHYPRCTIGEYKGKPWSAVDSGFLNWIVNKPGMENDLKQCAIAELQRRQ